MVSSSNNHYNQKNKQLKKYNRTHQEFNIKLQKGDKPLGKTKFYFDVKNHSLVSKLEANVKKFGGKVELFLDQSVTLIISDRADKLEQNNSKKGKWGYTSGGSVGPPSLKSVEVPNSIWTPPTPLNGECPLSNSSINRGYTTHRTKSRVDAMLERALIQPQQCSVDPLDNALNWGIPVWTTDKLQTWLDRIYVSLKNNDTLKSVNRTNTEKNIKVRDLKNNYIKFESYKRDTRPIFFELPIWPTLNFDGEPGTCPFYKKSRDIEEDKVKTNKLNKDKKKEMTRKSRTTTAATTTTTPNVAAAVVTRTKRSDQLVTGYCEICHCNYKDLSKHVQSDKHLAFIRNDNNFLSLDTLINTGANVEAFLKFNQSNDDRQDLFTNGNGLIREDKVDDTVKSDLTDFDDKMVQCNGAQRKLGLKISSPRNLRTRVKRESGHLLRSKGSPWHENDKTEKFYEKFEKYTIKKRSKGTIWIEEDDSLDGKCSEDDKSDDNDAPQVIEKSPLCELNDIRLKNNDSIETSPKKNNLQFSKLESERKDRKIKNELIEDEINKNNNSDENIKSKNNISNDIIKTPDKKCNGNSPPKLGSKEEINNEQCQINNESIVQESNEKLNQIKVPNDSNDTKSKEINQEVNVSVEKNNEEVLTNSQVIEVGKTVEEKPKVNNRNNKRSVRSCKAKQRLSVEERLIEDNRAYYKVEVLSNKLRSSAAYNTNTTNNNSNQCQTIVEVEDKVEVKKEDGPSSEKPVVVRFKRVRKSELSLLSDEAESFMFGDSRRDDTWDSDSEHDQTSSSSVYPKDTESESNDINNSSSSIRSSSPIICDESITIKQEIVDDDNDDDEDDDDSLDSKGSKKRGCTQTEVLIKDNSDGNEVETPSSRLSSENDPPTNENIDNNVNHSNSEAIAETKVDLATNNQCISASENVDKDNNVNKTDENLLTNIEEKLYPSKPSAEIEKMCFSFESIPKSEPWYQTYQRQDKGAEFWHCFSESDERKPFLLPYEMENFHENLVKIFQKNEARKKIRNSCPNGFGRSPRKSPRCHASTLAIMSTIIRKKEREQEQLKQALALSLIEESRSGANTPKLDAKSSEDQELRDIVKSIDDMLNADDQFEDSFQPELFDSNLEYLTDAQQPSGPPINLIEIIVNSNQYLNGIENSSCASSECGEIITESPMKRRKRRKNRTGWPGVKTKRKPIKQVVVPPDLISERDSTLNNKNINIKVEPEDDEDEEEDDDDEDEEDEDENSKKNKLNVNTKTESSISSTTSASVSNDSRVKIHKMPSDYSENQIINDSEDYNNVDIEITPKKNHNRNDENHENIVFRPQPTVRTPICTRQQLNLHNSLTRRRQLDFDSRPSSSVTIDNSQSENENHDSLLNCQKSGIISRKNYSLSKRTQRESNRLDNNKLDVTNDSETSIVSENCDSPCKTKNSVNNSVKKQIKTRKRQRISTSESNFEDENYKKDHQQSDVDCNLTVSNKDMRQRRSSIEFQPVVRVMKIEDQVEMDNHNILSVTVASNRRLRSSSSPKLSVSPPAKRYKRSKGPLNRWIKNS